MKRLAHPDPRNLSIFWLATCVVAVTACAGDAPTFTARLEDDQIQIIVDSDAPLFQLSCSGWDAVLEKPSGASWVAIQDDRHPSSENPGFYLDGEYIEPSFNLGCDVVGCGELSTTLNAGYAREHIKVGEMPHPGDDGGVSEELADVVETRPLTGRVRVRFQYAASDQCDSPVEVARELAL